MMQIRRESMSLVGIFLLAGIASADDFVPVTDETLIDPEPADWMTWRGTPDSLNFSPLDQIDRGNVSELEIVWVRELERAPSQEGTPLVYDGVMYYPGPMDTILALDAATGEELWEYRRDLPEDVGHNYPFPQTNRNLAIYGNLIIDNGADATIYAVDARTGELVWETEIHDYKQRASKQGSGPIVADGKLISGRNCQPIGGPESCYITAHDAVTGEELWRTRTIPRPADPGGDSWGDVPDERRWHVGTWMPPSYDPELGLVYFGTSVTAPSPKYMLDGNDKQYLYHNSTLALDVDSGEIVWYFQHLVDHWDLDYAFERILVDIDVAPNADEVSWINPDLTPGQTYKVVTGIPGKPGLIYTLDRETGEFLWARTTIEQNVVADIDPSTGTATVNPDTLFTGPDQTRLICPNANGGKNWPGGTYDPRTDIMYFAMANTCMNATSYVSESTPEMHYALRWENFQAPGADTIGTLQAYSAETGELVWRHDQNPGLMALLGTAGDLVFGGDVGGNFRAFDAESGEVLWEANLGAAITGHPVAFAVDGRQYVAVTTGRATITRGLSRSAGPQAGPASGADAGDALVVIGLP